MDNLNTKGVIETRSDTLFGIASRSSDYYQTAADLEYHKLKKEKIAEINREIERRKISYDMI